MPRVRWRHRGRLLRRAGIDQEDRVDGISSPESESSLNKALESLGIDVESDDSIVVSLSNDELYEEMRRATRQVPFVDTTIPIPSPEHLIVCMAMVDRPKDWIDIDRILVATSPLEVEEIASWLVRMVGEADPRVEKLRETRDRLGV